MDSDQDIQHIADTNSAEDSVGFNKQLSETFKKEKKSYRKKVERVWSTDEILTLIREVEARKVLWDAGSDGFKLPKDSLWRQVADAIPAGVNDCKGKWTNLRTSFNSNLNKHRKKKSGQAANHATKITWQFFKPMLFLESNKVQQSSKSTTSMELVCIINNIAIIE